MRSIGIGELRQQASRHFPDVQRGETIEVTDRGRPGARLVPVPASGVVEQLRADGRLAPAEGHVRDLPGPLEPVRGRPSLSDILAAMRADER